MENVLNIVITHVKFAYSTETNFIVRSALER